MDSPGFSVATDEGANALDLLQILSTLIGRGVVSGGGCHDGSTPFGVEVLSTTGWFPHSQSEITSSVTDGNTATGETIQRSSATVDLSEYVDDTHPRKVLICLPRKQNGNAGPGGDDNLGPYHVVAGEAIRAQPTSYEEFKKTEEPPVPDLGEGTTGNVPPEDLIPLSAAWVGANEDGVEERHLWDRRQRPDAQFRHVWAETLTLANLIDGAGVSHSGELADATDIPTDQEIIDTVTPTLDYFTPEEARSAVRGVVDLNELSAANGSEGSIIFVDSNGSPYYALPPDEWEHLQAAIDKAVANGVTPTYDSLEVSDITITNSETYPDGTVETDSPDASAGNVTTFDTLGDVIIGPDSGRPSPTGSGNWYFTTDQQGGYYDDPNNDPAAWDVAYQFPGNIDSTDLGYTPITATGTHDFEADQSMGGYNLIDVADPTQPRHAVPKIWADSQYIAQSDESNLSVASADNAANAIQLGGVGPTGYVSSDGGNVTVEDGILTHWNGHSSIHGERSVGEVMRIVGGTADWVFTSENGTGRTSQVYNAYHDGSEWRYQISNEPATRQTRNPPNGNGMVFQTADASLSGEVISWSSATIDGGSIDQADNASSLGGHAASKYPRRDNTSQWETILEFDEYGPSDAANDIRVDSISDYHVLKILLQTSVNSTATAEVMLSLGTDANSYQYLERNGAQFTNRTGNKHFRVLSKTSGEPYTFVSEIKLHGGTKRQNATEGTIISAEGAASGWHLVSGYCGDQDNSPTIDLYAKGNAAGNTNLAGSIVGKRF